MLSGSVEPDDFANGQNLSTVDPNVTLSEVADTTTTSGSDVFASNDGTGHASTGVQSFGGTSSTWGDVIAARLRMDFHVEVTAISLDVIGRDLFGFGDLARFQIYDAGNNLLDTYTTATLADGTIETMSLTSETPMAFAIAYGVGSVVYLDHLVYSGGEEPSATGIVINGGSDNRSGINTLTITFDDLVTIGSPADLVLFNHTTGSTVAVPGATLSGNGTTAVTWNLHENDFDLSDGYYTAELASSAATPNLAQTASFLFWKLSGDIDGDAAVNFNDTVPLSLNFGATGVTPFSDGDGDGDGNVNFNDTVPLSLGFGTTLSPPSPDLDDAPDPSNATLEARDEPRHVIDEGETGIPAAAHQPVEHVGADTEPEPSDEEPPPADALIGVTLGDVRGPSLAFLDSGTGWFLPTLDDERDARRGGLSVLNRTARTPT